MNAARRGDERSLTGSHLPEFERFLLACDANPLLNRARTLADRQRIRRSVWKQMEDTNHTVVATPVG